MKQQCLLLVILGALGFVLGLSAASVGSSEHKQWVQSVNNRVHNLHCPGRNTFSQNARRTEDKILQEVRQRLEQEGNQAMYCHYEQAGRRNGNVHVAPADHVSLLRAAIRGESRRLFEVLVDHGADLFVLYKCDQNDHTTFFEQLFKAVAIGPVDRSELSKRKHRDAHYKLLYFLSALRKKQRTMNLLTTVVSSDSAYIILDMDNDSERTARMLQLLRVANHEEKTFLDRVVNAHFRSHPICIKLIELGVRLKARSSLQRSLACPCLWLIVPPLCAGFIGALGGLLDAWLLEGDVDLLRRWASIGAAVGGGLGALVGLGMFCHDEGITLRERYAGWKHGITDFRGNRIAAPD